MTASGRQSFLQNFCTLKTLSTVLICFPVISLILTQRHFRIWNHSWSKSEEVILFEKSGKKRLLTEWAIFWCFRKGGVEKGQLEVRWPSWGAGASQLPLQGYCQNATWDLTQANPTRAHRPLHMARLAPVYGLVVVMMMASEAHKSWGHQKHLGSLLQMQALWPHALGPWFQRCGVAPQSELLTSTFDADDPLTTPEKPWVSVSNTAPSITCLSFAFPPGSVWESFQFWYEILADKRCRDQDKGLASEAPAVDNVTKSRPVLEAVLSGKCLSDPRTQRKGLDGGKEAFCLWTVVLYEEGAPSWSIWEVCYGIFCRCKNWVGEH